MQKTYLVTSTEDAATTVQELFGDAGPQVRTEGHHLGHPLTVPWDPRRAAEMVLYDAYPFVQDLFAQPLPLYARIRAWNMLLAPRLTYHLE